MTRCLAPVGLPTPLPTVGSASFAHICCYCWVYLSFQSWVRPPTPVRFVLRSRSAEPSGVSASRPRHGPIGPTVFSGRSRQNSFLHLIPVGIPRWFSGSRQLWISPFRRMRYTCSFRIRAFEARFSDQAPITPAARQPQRMSPAVAGLLLTGAALDHPKRRDVHDHAFLLELWLGRGIWKRNMRSLSE
jgi:hypothetical protein